jgi:nitroreductase
MAVGAGGEARAADEAGPGDAGPVAGTDGPALMVLSAPPGSPVPTGPEAPVMEVLRTMRAMRRLKPDPVPRELLEQLVEAAIWAPSASNQQLYSYVVVTDRAQMARLGVLWRDVQRKYLAAAALLDPETLADPATAPMLEALRYQAEHFDETPAVIAACYARPQVPRDPRLFASLIREVGMSFLRSLANPRSAVVAGASSSYPGVQNLLLAARALGLAANITVWHFFAENEFKRVLGVPKHVTVYALVPVGWPAGRFGPVRRRPVADVVRWDRWS